LFSLCHAHRGEAWNRMMTICQWFSSVMLLESAHAWNARSTLSKIEEILIRLETYA